MGANMMKNNKKKIIKYIIIIILILVFAISLPGIINPLRRPAWLIQAHMLLITPIGTGMEDVINFVESNENWDVRINYNSGFLKQEPGKPRITIGEKSIRVFHGQYSTILNTFVTVYYGFDENENLIDIWVWKDTPLL
jgi:hypothetical protein